MLMGIDTNPNPLRHFSAQIWSLWTFVFGFKKCLIWTMFKYEHIFSSGLASLRSGKKKNFFISLILKWKLVCKLQIWYLFRKVCSQAGSLLRSSINSKFETQQIINFSDISKIICSILLCPKFLYISSRFTCKN